MTVVARYVASTPARTANETWAKIVELLAGSDSAARGQLDGASGVACAALASEAVAEAPIVIWGSGPRVRIYCVFGEDAITGDGVNEEPLVRSPVSGNWKMSIPCTAADLEWSRKSLEVVGTRIRARGPEDSVEGEGRQGAEARSTRIAPEEFLKS